jgi:hypothetical protein
MSRLTELQEKYPLTSITRPNLDPYPFCYGRSTDMSSRYNDGTEEHFLPRPSFEQRFDAYGFTNIRGTGDFDDSEDSWRVAGDTETRCGEDEFND